MPNGRWWPWEASPTTAILDSQSARGAVKGGPRSTPSGYDAGKTVPGRKRPILTHTLGLLLAVIVHPAPVQDRDGAKTLRREARRSFPLIARIIADAGYQGRTMEAVVARTGVWERPIVRRCDRPRFGVLPKRWIVERTLAWISRCCRLARDYERHARKAAAFVRLAMIRLRLRRLAARPRSKSNRPGSALRATSSRATAWDRSPLRESRCEGQP